MKLQPVELVVRKSQNVKINDVASRNTDTREAELVVVDVNETVIDCGALQYVSKPNINIVFSLRRSGVVRL